MTEFSPHEGDGSVFPIDEEGFELTPEQMKEEAEVQQLAVDLRIDALDLLRRHGALRRGFGWAVFTLTEHESFGGLAAPTVDTEVLLLAYIPKERLDRTGPNDVMPPRPDIKIIKKEQLGDLTKPDDDYLLTTEFGLDDESHAQVMIDSQPVYDEEFEAEPELDLTDPTRYAFFPDSWVGIFDEDDYVGQRAIDAQNMYETRAETEDDYEEEASSRLTLGDFPDRYIPDYFPEDVDDDCEKTAEEESMTPSLPEYEGLDTIPEEENTDSINFWVDPDFGINTTQPIRDLPKVDQITLPSPYNGYDVTVYPFGIYTNSSDAKYAIEVGRSILDSIKHTAPVAHN